MIEALKAIKPKRVLPMIDPDHSMSQFGGAHYLTAHIPQDAQTTTITGLYAEGATLTPFLMPTTAALSAGKMKPWGEQLLAKVSLFTGQDPSLHWKRMKHLGVDTVVVASEDLNNVVQYALASQSASKREILPYVIYQLSEPEPFIETIPNKPMLFLDYSSSIHFKDLAQGLFIHPSAYRIPVVDGGSDAEYWLRKRDEVSAVVIAAENLGIESVPMLAEFRVPIFLLNPPEDLQMVLNGDPVIQSRFSFVPSEELEKNGQAVMAWVGLGEDLLKLSEKGKALEFSEVENQVYRFTHNGWSFLRLGFAQDWKCESAQPCLVRRATPGFIAVRSEGEVTLRFVRPGYLSTLFWVSFLGGVSLLILPLGMWLLHKKTDKSDQDQIEQPVSKKKKSHQ
jgi:hypothetical protein